MASSDLELKQRVIATASSVFKVPVSQIDATSSRDTIKSWDSLQHLQLIIALEELFKVRFDADEIMRMHRLDQIIETLKSKVSS